MADLAQLFQWRNLIIAMKEFITLIGVSLDHMAVISKKCW